MDAGHKKVTNEATIKARNLQDCSPSIRSTTKTRNTDTYCVWMRVNMVPTRHPSQDRGLYNPLTGQFYPV